jgi:hypothetical protein
MPIDLKRLAAEVSIQHGIRIDADDPMMAVVTLNRLMLEAAAAEIVENLQSAARNFQDAAEKVQLRAGARLARDFRECAAAIRMELRAGGSASATTTANLRDETRSRSRQRWFRQLIAAGIIFLAGVGVGLSLRIF